MNRPRKVSRLARRIFRPLIGATEPVQLDLRGVDEMDAYAAIHEVGDLVRCGDAPTPLGAKYVFTAGSAGAFRSTWDRIRGWWRRTTWRVRA